MDLIARIDDWGRLYPDRPAHVTATHVLTYGQLTLHSSRLAAYFRRSLPADHSPVAILGHKESEMLIGFIGAVRAGHPYIPLDASLPRGRVDSIVATAGATLLTTDELRTILAAEAGGATRTAAEMSADDIWYIIFTSGSTGDPKGVMITRGCLESFVGWTLDEQGFVEARETYLNQAPFSFDLSVMDLYSSLATAGTLFSVSQSDIAEPRQLFDQLGRSGVTIWVSTPSFARFCLMQPTFGRDMLPSLRKFWFCGETLAPEIAAGLLQRFPGAEVWNTYGPTEATVATSSIQITDRVLQQYNPLPVGRPKAGTVVSIRNERDVDVGEQQRGEIVIAGPNVGLGYVNRPDLTQRAFFETAGMRAYRTGDWGHYEDGLLFFEGRMDFQIKLHGYRIEIGDIESNLHRLETVQDAVVLPSLRDGRPEFLVAFTILKETLNGTEFEMGQELRRQLAERLPDYMVPRKFVFLSQFPTTANGKIDRQQLARTLQ